MCHQPPPPRISAEYLLVALVIPLFSVVAGCRGTPQSQPPCAQPVTIHVVADGGERLNLGHRGEPWPTHLRLYQLAAAPSLETVDISLLAKGDDQLGADVIDQREHVLYPSSHERWSLTLDPKATHLALVAFFRNPEPGTWGTSIALPPPSPTCPAADAPLPCVFVSVDGSELRGGATPPATFVGDGKACKRLPTAIIDAI
ncbi:MAG TPA: type VI secretion system lipoprotein TssJ [Nannocystis exedens]|nr:type VI secretion system lipoprotein TssJ [Nannocystis exedens]